MSLSRLTDRIDADPSGGEVVVARWGMWATTAEIERWGKRKYKLVYKGKVKDEFKSLEEAEAALKDFMLAKRAGRVS